jgi:alkanesulfonate monooxygenase SsuD/methylene tetrahydromethanopterin reductase-like flavin-dependent oxidoreductase (luciferase family)
MFPADHLLPMARAAEAAGFDSITVPDSVFYPETVSAKYPYSADGGRFWPADTPFVDPFVSIAAMAAVTERIRFLTNVVKLPIRDPLMVAKQLASHSGSACRGSPRSSPGPTRTCAPGASGPTR